MSVDFDNVFQASISTAVAIIEGFHLELPSFYNQGIMTILALYPMVLDQQFKSDWYFFMCLIGWSSKHTHFEVEDIILCICTTGELSPSAPLVS